MNAGEAAANALETLGDGLDSCDMSDMLLDAARRAAVQAALGGASKKLGAWNASDRIKAWKAFDRADGLPPRRKVEIERTKTGERATIRESMELHHTTPRSKGGGNEKENLVPAWPTDHAAMDPSRRPGYAVKREIHE